MELWQPGFALDFLALVQPLSHLLGWTLSPSFAFETFLLLFLNHLTFLLILWHYLTLLALIWNGWYHRLSSEIPGLIISCDIGVKVGWKVPSGVDMACPPFASRVEKSCTPLASTVEGACLLASGGREPVQLLLGLRLAVDTSFLIRWSCSLNSVKEQVIHSHLLWFSLHSLLKQTCQFDLVSVQ